MLPPGRQQHSNYVIFAVVCVTFFWTFLAPGSSLGVPALCRGPFHLPVLGRHWREAGQTYQQQFSAGRVVWPRLRLPLHRWVSFPGVTSSHCVPVSLKLSTRLNVSLQCLWCWEPVSQCRWAPIQTGCSSAASLGCSCSTAPTGKPTCQERCALACESTNDACFCFLSPFED